MANHKSAIKRAQQNRVRRVRNMGYKTRVKTAIKEVGASISDKSQEQAQKKLTEAVSLLQKTASKGVIHERNASRKISRLAKQLNRLSTQQP